MLEPSTLLVVPQWRPPLVSIELAALTLLLTAVFLIAHARYPGLPTAGTETGGWRDWSDQRHYIDAARAWAAWDLTPERHWYPPGYALLGAPFLRITPHDRFLLPDLACLIACLFACAALARRMFPDSRFAAPWGAAAFLVASVGRHAVPVRLGRKRDLRQPRRTAEPSR